MGTWGPGILQNDTTVDIWAEFKHYYNEGQSSSDIRILLESEYEPDNEIEYFGEIWTGIAYGQWMAGDLEAYTLDKVTQSLDEKCLTLWAEDPKFLKKRISVINDFILKIQVPRPRKLTRKKIIERPAYFHKGDIIGLKINSEEYLTAIVVKHDDNPIDGEHTIVFIDHTFKNIPTITEILKSEILYLDIGGQNNYFRGFFDGLFSSSNMARKIKDVIKVGQLDAVSFMPLGLGVGFGNWNNVPELYKEQLLFLEKNKSDKPFSVIVNDLMNPTAELENKLINLDKKIFREKLNNSR